MMDKLISVFFFTSVDIQAVIVGDDYLFASIDQSEVQEGYIAYLLLYGSSVSLRIFF